MTVCKYFLEGRCRFGDRCRFEHISDYPQYEENYAGSRSDRYNWYSPGYEVPRYEQQRNSHYDDFNNRWAGNQRNHGARSLSQDSTTWYSTEYGDQNHRPSYEHRPSKYDDYSYASSQRNSNLKYSSSNSTNKATKNRDDLNLNSDVEIVKEDAIAWEKGEQWPFTCYFPFKGHPAFPGFEDTSPEELRYEAIQAKKNNTFPSYVQSVSQALENVKNNRELLKNADVNADVRKIVKQLKEEKLDLDTDNVRRQLLFSDLESVSDGPFEMSKPVENLFKSGTSSFGSASSFSFKLAHLQSKDQGSAEMYSMNVTSTPFKQTDDVSPFKFSFALPSAGSEKVHSEGILTVYTPVEKLTKVELEEFTAPTFTFGRIPTHPPSKEMCF